MRYIELSSQLRIRPSHLLLMVYRYVSGVYQVGDISALNYIKGFFDGQRADTRGLQILTVSGHGIGEAEIWLAERMPESTIETVSFRLIDTQLWQFLRAAKPDDIAEAFQQFAGIVAPYEHLAALVNEEGLVPYWRRQAEAIARCSQRGSVQVYSLPPTCICASRKYDLIYVSHGTRYLSQEAIGKIRSHLNPNGYLAVLTPVRASAADSKTVSPPRFADCPSVRKAKARFVQLLTEYGYSLGQDERPPLGQWNELARCERISFSVLTPASSFLTGSLILRSLGEHISERARLEALNRTAAEFNELEMPVHEELELILLGAEAGTCNICSALSPQTVGRSTELSVG